MDAGGASGLNTRRCRPWTARAPSIRAYPAREHLQPGQGRGSAIPSIIPLWFGEGDVPAPAFIGEAMARAIAAGHVFYTHQNGIPELRQALARLPDRPGRAAGRRPSGSPSPFSGMNAIMLAIQLACEPGDNIIAIDPVWPNTGGMARLRRRRGALGADGPRPGRLDPRSGQGRRPDGRSHARRVLRLARQPDRRDGPAGDAGGAAGALPRARRLADRRRGLQPPGVRPHAARRPSSTSPSRKTG